MDAADWFQKHEQAFAVNNLNAKGFACVQSLGRDGPLLHPDPRDSHFGRFPYEGGGTLWFHHQQHGPHLVG